MGTHELTAIADRGHFKRDEILACHEAEIGAIVPRPVTSSATAHGRTSRADLIYGAERVGTETSPHVLAYNLEACDESSGKRCLDGGDAGLSHFVTPTRRESKRQDDIA